jgi:hypothetical protein
MTFTFAQILALAATIFGATAAEGSPRLQAYAVKLLGYQGDDLRIAVELPCGSEFLGLITTSDNKGGLFIAAASMQPEILCTSLPSEQEIVVKYLATSGFKAIQSMSTDGLLNRLTLLPVNEVLTGKKRGGGRMLRAVYETRCGSNFGTLIKQVGKEDLEVAVVELKERPLGMASSGLVECNFEQKMRPINAVALDEGFTVRPLAIKPVDVSRAFYLRLAPIDEVGLRHFEKEIAAKKVLPTKPLVVSYFRACNEAPVGLVIGKPVSKTDSKTKKTVREVKVGVLVARYLNRRCDFGDKGQWTEIKATDMNWHIAENDKTRLHLLSMAASKGFGGRNGGGQLSLKAPFELDRLTAKGRSVSRLHIDFFRTCESTLGAVYARDAAGRLAVGVLTQSVSKKYASQCKKAETRVSYKASMMQPFLANHVRAADLYPMKLKGI